MRLLLKHLLLVVAVLWLAVGLLPAQTGSLRHNPTLGIRAPRTGTSGITTKLGYRAAAWEDSIIYPAGIGVSVPGDIVYITDDSTSYIYGDRDHMIKSLPVPSFSPHACRMKMALYFGDDEGNVFQVTDHGTVTLYSQVSSDLFISGLDVDLATGAVYFVANNTSTYNWSGLYRVPPGGGKAVLLTAWTDAPSWGLAVRGNYVYMTDYRHDILWKYLKNGKGNWSEVLTSLDGPTDIQFDKAGNMFVAEYGGGDLARVQAGTTKIVRIVSGMNTPYYLHLDQSGTIYLSDDSANLIYKIWK